MRQSDFTFFPSLIHQLNLLGITKLSLLLISLWGPNYLTFRETSTLKLISRSLFFAGVCSIKIASVQINLNSPFSVLNIKLDLLDFIVIELTFDQSYYLIRKALIHLDFCWIFPHSNKHHFVFIFFQFFDKYAKSNSVWSLSRDDLIRTNILFEQNCLISRAFFVDVESL